MFLGVKNNEIRNYSLNVCNEILIPNNNVTLLGVTIDKQLKFSSHIDDICKKANNKLCTIMRLRNSITEKQTKLLTNAHILSYFKYCNKNKKKR